MTSYACTSIIGPWIRYLSITISATLYWWSFWPVGGGQLFWSYRFKIKVQSNWNRGFRYEKKCTKHGFYEFLVMPFWVVQCTLNIHNPCEHRFFRAYGRLCNSLHWWRLGASKTAKDHTQHPQVVFPTQRQMTLLDMRLNSQAIWWWMMELKCNPRMEVARDSKET